MKLPPLAAPALPEQLFLAYWLCKSGKSRESKESRFRQLTKKSLVGAGAPAPCRSGVPRAGFLSKHFQLSINEASSHCYINLTVRRQTEGKIYG
jgi:hypothetical protein